MSTPTIVSLPDLPLPRRSNFVVAMSAERARKTTIETIIIALCLAVPAFFLWRAGHHGWGGFLGVLAVFCFIAAVSKKSLLAPCPFCGNAITGILSDRSRAQEVRCGQCYEYSVVQGGKVQPMDQSRSTDKPRFLSPVFEGAVWPAGCVACGATPTRRDEVKDRSVNAVGLALGRVMTTTASLSNIPYCSVHKGSVELIVGQTKTMDLKWCSLRMMRHYLALNKGKQSLGSRRSLHA